MSLPFSTLLGRLMRRIWVSWWLLLLGLRLGLGLLLARLSILTLLRLLLIPFLNLNSTVGKFL
jgi:hypothetical protein